MQEPLPKYDLEVIRMAAARGARSQTVHTQNVTDAIEATVEAWENKLMNCRAVRNWEAWAFRVAANAAKRAAARSPRAISIPSAGAGQSPPGDHHGLDPTPALRRTLRLAIVSRGSRLIGRQLEVVLKLLEPQMSLHRAARELCMDRTALRRSFRTALARLRGSS